MFKRVAFIALLVLATRVDSFGAPTTAPSDQEVVTRVYDISDLLWSKTDYPAPTSTMEMFAGGGGGGGGGGQPMLFGGGQAPAEAPHPSHQDLVDQIVKLLTDTIAPQTWKDNGGSIGSLRELSGQLVVTQIPENHQKIQEVLQALRADRGRMVIVRAYWVMLDPNDVPPLTTQAGTKQLPQIDDKLIDAKHLYCAAQTMCFSGQTVSVVSGRTRSIVTDMTPVVGSNAVGYNPTVASARNGVVLQVTPHLEPEGADARCVVDLQSDVTDLGNINGNKIELPATTQPYSAVDSIDRINEVRQEMRTTVRLPLDKKILVGGMTLEPAAKEATSQQLYLVIEADAVK